jgi:hypothetical protein
LRKYQRRDQHNARRKPAPQISPWRIFSAMYSEARIASAEMVNVGF